MLKKFYSAYFGLPREIYVIFFARVINAMGLFIFPLLTLILRNKIGLSAAETGFYVALSPLLFIPSSLIGGKLCDLYGRKKLIIIADTLAGCCYLVCAMIEPTHLMIVLIMMASTFMGFSEPAHNALIADVTTEENRNESYSLAYLGFNLGFVVGPIIGSLLLENHLKLLFLGDGLTTLCAVLLMALFIKESYPKEKRQKASTASARNGSVLKIIVKKPILIYFAIVLMGYNFVYAQWGFMMPMHSESLFKDGITFFGKLASLNGLIVIVMTPIVTKYFSKMNNVKSIVIGGLFYTVGFSLLGFFNLKAFFVLAVTIFTLGEIIITINYMPFIIKHTPETHRGRMSALLPIFMGLGFSFGPMVMGVVTESFGMFTAWRIVGVIMLLNTLMMFVIYGFDRRANNVRQVAEPND